MKDITPIVKAAKRIESLLEEKYGAQGRGLHEKLTSVQRRVPAELHKTIRYVATVRNKAVHEDDYELDDAQSFLNQADRVVRALEAAPVMPARSSLGTFFKLAFVILLGTIALSAMVLSSKERPSDAARTPSASSAPSARQTASSAPPVKQTASGAPPARQTQRSGKAGGNAPTAEVPSSDAAERFAKGEHVALDSSLLKVEKITLTIAKGSFGRLEPRIQLTVKNTSEKTLSSASYDVRLFIDSQPRPVIEQQASGLSRGGLFVSFGEQGLKAGASALVTPVLSDERAWAVPDILNANRWQLVLRNSGVRDGSRKSVDVKAPAFTSLPGTTPIYTAPAPSAPAKAAGPVDFAAALRDGVSAGAGNEALSLRILNVKLVRGSFNRLQPVITLDATNIGERTLSNAGFQARLYLDGQDTPVLETQDGQGGGGGVLRGFSRAPRSLFAHFGDRGLAPGQTQQIQLRPDDSEWTSPDVLNAKSHLVLLRVVETRDGLKKPYGGTAQKLP